MPALKPGDFVRYSVPPDCHAEPYCRGLVVTTAVVRSLQGRRSRVEVRWFSPEGRPSEDTVFHDPQELTSEKNEND